MECRTVAAECGFQHMRKDVIEDIEQNAKGREAAKVVQPVMSMLEGHCIWRGCSS